MVSFAWSAAGASAREPASSAPVIEVWYGDSQRVGHRGDAQDDFNVLGHIESWREIDTLQWALNKRAPVFMNFRSFRRLAAEGDFNADIPIALLRPGANTVTITAKLGDGRSLSRTVTLMKETGATPLPCTIRWAEVADLQSVGQIVDGLWVLTPEGLRTERPGYDRIFLIGERTWRDYEVRTSFTVHGAKPESRDAGVGLLARFTGHVTGGPNHFPSGQPKWGYLPFGAIGWLRWKRNHAEDLPHAQFFPGDGARPIDKAEFPFRSRQTYAMRFACRSLPDDTSGHGVTRYQFKIWPAETPEPSAWSWEHTQASATALRSGGVALLAHQLDVTFGDVFIVPLP